jgi:hypothetical protein
MRGINEDISNFVIWMSSLSLCCTETGRTQQVYSLTTNRGSETAPRLRFSYVFFSASGRISVQYLENGHSYFLHRLLSEMHTHTMSNNLWNWHIVTHLAHSQLAKAHYRKWVNLMTSQLLANFNVLGRPWIFDGYSNDQEIPYFKEPDGSLLSSKRSNI